MLKTINCNLVSSTVERCWFIATEDNKYFGEMLPSSGQQHSLFLTWNIAMNLSLVVMMEPNYFSWMSTFAKVHIFLLSLDFS